MSAPAGTLAGLSQDLAATVELVGRSVVAIHARRRIPSSGIVWRPGVVATAAHTITRDEDISVTLASGRTTAAALAGRDPATDLAVLRLDDAAVPPAERGAAADLQVGRLVLALGRPGPQLTASMGIISAVGGEWRTWQGGRIEQFLRLDLAIYDGFSGGPLVEAGGRVLGLNTSGLSRAMALALPAATVDRVADQLLASGRVSRGYLGVAVQPVQLPARLRERLGLTARLGLVVVNLEGGGPAETAGLLLGDVLVALDGTGVEDPADLLAALAPDRVGRPVELRVVRAGELQTVAVTVGERPDRRGR
ncbi:MAG TPA: trypsin-like peptidase domain-containing protein [Gemmatimonadales bacterium]|nr:trypsin-like peptidase domain-containing protein [Gemmatimonadales bacterium]